MSLTANVKQNWSAETFGGLVMKGSIGKPAPIPGGDGGPGTCN